MVDFVSVVLADTEDTWRTIFRQGGENYREPKLVLFSGMYPTACGMGQSAAGPFYCPEDEKVYIDLSFFRLLQERFRARIVSLEDVQVAQVEQADGDREVVGSLGFLFNVKGAPIGVFGLIVIAEVSVKQAELVQPDRRLKMARAELFFTLRHPLLRQADSVLEVAFLFQRQELLVHHLGFLGPGRLGGRLRGRPGRRRRRTCRQQDHTPQNAYPKVFYPAHEAPLFVP